MTLLWLIFVTVVGACVGSFLNVVAYRLPIGKSIVTPPSACPKCDHKLAWHDNIPVLGWIMLRGRCRYCSNPISAQYPIIEAITALLFGGWFYVCYFTKLRPDFAGPGLEGTALIFAVSLILIAGLMVSTLIDARLYIIPLEIPWLVTVIAVIALPLAVGTQFDATAQVHVPPRIDVHTDRLQLPSERLAQVRPTIYRDSAEVRRAAKKPEGSTVLISAAPYAQSFDVSLGAFMAAVGLIVSNSLLRLKWIPQSFAEDPAAHDKATPRASEDSSDPSTWIAHAHPRREVLKEILFLVPPFLGFLVGSAVTVAPSQHPEVHWEGTLGGVLLGYLVGGLTVWLTRILGTLGFGKEAMGLGDVHLMAAVGAVTGWQVAVLAFFVAPFFGLTWAVASAGAAKLMHRKVRVIPYGPHLAIATLVVMVFRESLLEQVTALLTGG